MTALQPPHQSQTPRVPCDLYLRLQHLPADLLSPPQRPRETTLYDNSALLSSILTPLSPPIGSRPLLQILDPLVPHRQSQSAPCIGDQPLKCPVSLVMHRKTCHLHLRNLQHLHLPNSTKGTDLRCQVLIGVK